MTRNQVFRIILASALPAMVAAAPNQNSSVPTGPTAPPTNSQGNPNPAATAQNTGQLMQRNGGSLLRATLANEQPDSSQAQLNDMSFFAVPAPEPKVLKKHDLVTIIVREETDFSADGTTDLKKDYDLDFRIQQFIRASLENFSLEPTNGSTGSQILLGGKSKFKGEATVDRVDALTTRITAEVVDVKPNGTVVLQAKAHTKFDEEEMTMILSGTCRAEDVTGDNTILSSQLHDKNLIKEHKGAVRDTTRRGWIPRFFDWIRLF